MSNKKLIVIGDGPDRKKLCAKARANIGILSYQPVEIVRDYMQRARAFVFMAEEDFGIAPVEAQACGTPVIAYGRGGLTETIIPGETGLLFPAQSSESMMQAVSTFESGGCSFDPERIRKNAERFSAERFRQEFAEQIEREWTLFTRN
jgi:glycosyltransferase involved in cell wall biosynthesis